MFINSHFLLSFQEKVFFIVRFKCSKQRFLFSFIVLPSKRGVFFFLPSYKQEVFLLFPANSLFFCQQKFFYYFKKRFFFLFIVLSAKGFLLYIPSKRLFLLSFCQQKFYLLFQEDIFCQQKTFLFVILLAIKSFFISVELFFFIILSTKSFFIVLSTKKNFLSPCWRKFSFFFFERSVNLVVPPCKSYACKKR